MDKHQRKALRRQEEERRKELRRQYEAQQQAEARAKLGLGPEQLRDLRAYLSALLVKRGGECGHCFQGVNISLQRTRRWAIRVGLDPKRVVESIREVGGFCDCWVVKEVTPERFGWPEEQPPCPEASCGIDPSPRQ
jgi:hypothetical protein